jgi:hypothetical protein
VNGGAEKNRLKSIPLPLEKISVQKYYGCTKARSGEMTA